ncbi:histidinol-phosphate transaminase [Kordia sp. YSTF-M3]|uniref:Histidinol-phosphate aminotransferase n=1 Tax=Kordia aestuariivivens TaxID=2759037 RepID=A0ABR7Q8R3_9FLAO|nr:histidinol-phosphate transaminase [Kordia aestuariivivens]MBC8754952.1 histidinol-phosphate transaminase [Kordia aestuariivivens]
MKTININSLIRENIKTLKPYSSARDEYKASGSEMVFLDANENPFENGVNRYPDPKQTAVKVALAEVKNCNPNNIVLGNGSDEILDLIFRAFCEPKKDNIITLPPTYGMYNVLAGINDIETKEVLLSESFEPKEDEILNAANENSKILFLCSPNNPTGNSFDNATVEKLLKEFNGIIVIDEAYIDFSEEESWLNRLEEFPNLIITQTLSKAYGMAGIRLGICYASLAIIEILNRIKPPYNVNLLTQAYALERIQDQEGVQLEIAQIQNNKDYLTKALKNVNFITKIFPSDANFILVKVDDANLRYNQLIAKGVVIRNRTTQPLCENCLRLTVGTELENKKLIEELLAISKS